MLHPMFTTFSHFATSFQLTKLGTTSQLCLVKSQIQFYRMGSMLYFSEPSVTSATRESDNAALASLALQGAGPFI